MTNDEWEDEDRGWGVMIRGGGVSFCAGNVVTDRQEMTLLMRKPIFKRKHCEGCSDRSARTLGEGSTLAGPHNEIPHTC